MSHRDSSIIFHTTGIRAGVTVSDGMGDGYAVLVRLWQ